MVHKKSFKIQVLNWVSIN